MWCRAGRRAARHHPRDPVARRVGAGGEGRGHRVPRADHWCQALRGDCAVRYRRAPARGADARCCRAASAVERPYAAALLPRRPAAVEHEHISDWCGGVVLLPTCALELCDNEAKCCFLCGQVPAPPPRPRPPPFPAVRHSCCARWPTCTPGTHMTGPVNASAAKYLPAKAGVATAGAFYPHSAIPLWRGRQGVVAASTGTAAKAAKGGAGKASKDGAGKTAKSGASRPSRRGAGKTIRGPKWGGC